MELQHLVQKRILTSLKQKLEEDWLKLRLQRNLVLIDTSHELKDQWAYIPHFKGASLHWAIQLERCLIDQVSEQGSGFALENNQLASEHSWLGRHLLQVSIEACGWEGCIG